MSKLRPLALLIVLAGCGATDPYVFTRDEFDRSAVGFGQQPEDIVEVQICHNGAVTSGATLREMAEEQCGRVGKAAAFRSTYWGDCPMATPAGAVFDCITRAGG